MGIPLARGLGTLVLAVSVGLVAPSGPATAGTQVAGTVTASTVPTACSAFEVVAHRGFHPAGVDENSIAAFEKAAARGMSVELDVYPDADGTLWVFHDSNVRYATRVDRDIETMTTAEVRRLRYRDFGSPLATLTSAMAVFADVPDLPVYIEPKRNRTAPAITQMILDAGRTDSTWLTANFVQVRQAHPEIRAVQKIPAGSSLDPAQVAASGVDTVALPPRRVTAARVAGFHDAGLRVQARLTDNTMLWRRAIAAGIDAQLTDEPTQARRFCPQALRAPSIRVAKASRRAGWTTIVVRGSALYDTRLVRLGRSKISFRQVSGSRVVARTTRKVNRASRITLATPTGRTSHAVRRR